MPIFQIVTSELFQSTPSEGRATGTNGIYGVLGTNFNPRPPRGGRLYHLLDRPTIGDISIHALRGEGDIVPLCFSWQSRISIHALRGEGDTFPSLVLGAALISIHALRGEGDWLIDTLRRRGLISIHALRGEGDVSSLRLKTSLSISIHALRGEGDAVFFIVPFSCPNFNPRPPRGGRHWASRNAARSKLISIHALRGEGDWSPRY